MTSIRSCKELYAHAIAIGDHVLMLERLLERTPEEIIDWASLYAHN